MAKRRHMQVREPLQVYLAEDERTLLDRLAAESGVSRAEVLRRGIKALARAQEPWERSPVLEFMRELQGRSDALPSDVAERHDDYLAEEHRGEP